MTKTPSASDWQAGEGRGQAAFDEEQRRGQVWQATDMQLCRDVALGHTEVRGPIGGVRRHQSPAPPPHERTHPPQPHSTLVVS